MKRSPSRLRSEERREAIMNAARKAFAEKGYHGTTTRQLAEAAGVSEALLFKHFRTKEDLYAAMQCSCGEGQDREENKRILALTPSTSTLVHMVHFLVSRMLLGAANRPEEEQECMQRLMLQSVMEDGEFARTFLKRLESGWIAKFEQCIAAARKSGDIVDTPVQGRLRGWFTHHLAVQIMLSLIPPKPLVDYGVPREMLIEQVVWFALRGIGLKDEAISQHYNPDALKLLAR